MRSAADLRFVFRWLTAKSIAPSYIRKTSLSFHWQNTAYKSVSQPATIREGKDCLTLRISSSFLPLIYTWHQQISIAWNTLCHVSDSVVSVWIWKCSSTQTFWLISVTLDQSLVKLLSPLSKSDSFLSFSFRSSLSFTISCDESFWLLSTVKFMQPWHKHERGGFHSTREHDV